jgi:small subunit ribosomal protein S13
MIRLAGVNIQEKRQAWVGLTAIYGVGRSTALKICQKLRINPQTHMGDLSEDQINAIRNELERYTIEGDLRNEVLMNIKRLIDIGCYRGVRHRRGLPVRGQRTRTNARTRKGKRSAPVASKRKE